jgi:hypothetical protein
MAYDDALSRVWTMAPSDIDPTAWPTSYPGKTMMTVFSGLRHFLS